MHHEAESRYAWLRLWTTLALMTLGGAGMYAVTVALPPVQAEFGVGRGYHSREVETFGAPLLDADANREYFEEQLQLLLKCFNEEAFHFKGKYFECPPPVDYRGYRLKEITMVPRPKHLPVDRYVPPAEFEELRDEAYGLGFVHVESGPLVRSSYHAERHRPE